MSSIRFHCAICGARLSVAADAAGRVIDCPACRHVVPVPARWPGLPGGVDTVDSLPVLPPEILALEVKFSCPSCSAKLRIDARLEGQPVNCPKCAREICVPHWSATPVNPRLSATLRTAELSEAEIEFLSGPAEVTALHAAPMRTAG